MRSYPFGPLPGGKRNLKGTVVRWKVVPTSNWERVIVLQLTAKSSTFPLVYQWNEAPRVLGWLRRVENRWGRCHLSYALLLSTCTL